MFTYLVLTRYPSVTATSNIYYNTILLCENNGPSPLDLFICANYRRSSFYERVCFLVFAAPLRALFSLIWRFSWILALSSLCVNVLSYSVTVFFSFSGLLFLHNLHLLITMLRVGHQNEYRLYNKVPDLCVFLSQSAPSYNSFGITSQD